MAPLQSSSNNSNDILHLQAIGEPRIALDGHDVVLPTRHAAQALFMLALAEEGELPVPELGEQLWPDAASSQIPPRFATMVWQLRKSLGEHRNLLERNRRFIRVDRSKVSVDLVNLRTEASELLGKGMASAELAEKLRQPILASWDDYLWVREQQAINERLAKELKP
jgi:hypothetical protein